MNLLFDVGNTHTVIGIKENDFFRTWRIGTKSYETEDELFSVISSLFDHSDISIKKIDKIGVSSVVPFINEIIIYMNKKYINSEIYFINSDKKIYDIVYDVEYPREIGADRLANIIASRYEYGKNVIAVDFGTAITVDVMKDSYFTGGCIIPGFKTQMISLFSSTAKLPQVELIIPDYNLGKNTSDNIQIGVIKNTIYGIERLISEIEKETSCNYEVIITGGMSGKIKNYSDVFKIHDKYLTLKGIEYYLKNF